MAKSKTKVRKLPESPTVANEPLTLYISKHPLSNLIERSRTGITKNTLLLLAKKFTFSLSDLASIFQVSERTLQRYGSKEKFSTAISEKALILDELFTRGIQLFGSEEKFIAYIKAPNMACGGKTPMSFFDTTTGIQFIADELGRVEHGIY